MRDVYWELVYKMKKYSIFNYYHILLGVFMIKPILLNLLIHSSALKLIEIFGVKLI